MPSSESPWPSFGEDGTMFGLDEVGKGSGCRSWGLRKQLEFRWAPFDDEGDTSSVGFDIEGFVFVYAATPRAASLVDVGNKS